MTISVDDDEHGEESQDDDRSEHGAPEAYPLRPRRGNTCGGGRAMPRSYRFRRFGAGAGWSARATA